MSFRLWSAEVLAVTARYLFGAGQAALAAGPLLPRRSVLAAAAALPFTRQAAAASTATTPCKVAQLLDGSPYQRELARDHGAGLQAAIAEHNRGRAGARRPVQLEQVQVEGEAGRAQAMAALRGDPSVCALVGTAGEALALRSLALAREQRLGLVHVGPWLAESAHDGDADVVPLFASREMQLRHALTQLQGIGLAEVGVVFGTPQEQAQRGGGMLAAAQRSGTRMRLLGSLDSPSLQLDTGAPAVLLFAGGTVELARLTRLLAQRRLQRYVVSLADVDLATLLQIGSGRSVPLIVTQVVPNPATSALPVVRGYREQLRRLFDEAPTPLSLVGYLAGRYAAQVIARIEGPLNRATVMQAFARRPSIDLDGFGIRFDGSASRGSRYVTQTMLTADGRLIG